MESDLSGLDERERFVAVAVARATGARPQAWDVDGRQGAVDALLHYGDGRTGALEVTSHAGSGVEQTYSLLGQADFGWPLPGRWWWSANVGDAHDLPRFSDCYEAVILLCEAHDVPHPELLPWHVLDREPDARWLAWETDSSLIGHPSVPAIRADGERSKMMITPAGSGGVLDESLQGLPAAVEQLLEVPHISRRLAKVLTFDADEHHLAVALRQGAIPDPLYMVMMFEPKGLPDRDPTVPDGISHLWLLTGSGVSLIGWAAGSGWTDHRVFD
ncbi:hypothetical protein [Pseudactinotalea terrae]|uniref:hypothetical protein n=1 Tax=Pseudactinotalea terrae TaxID=1743262 RepID=UPI0012E13FC1|nr:hypothetical protein [Pseudactinotalea terrae]